MTEVPEAGVGAVYSHGWKRTWKNFLPLLGVTILVLVFGSVPGASQEQGHGSYGSLAPVYQILVYGPFSYGSYYFFLRTARDEKATFGDLFVGFRDYWNVVVANLLVWLIVGLGFLLLIVPGVIFGCKLVLTPYLVVDRKMRALDAMKESWRLTRGHALTVFLMALLAMPICLAGLLVLGVGVLASAIWIGLAFSAFYIAICPTETASEYGGAADVRSE